MRDFLSLIQMFANVPQSYAVSCGTELLQNATESVFDADGFGAVFLRV